MTKTSNFQAIYAEAHDAGMKAVAALNVVPMIVTQRANPLDDNSAIQKAYFVADGVCGFAYVNVKPGNSGFAKFLKQQGLARSDSYLGGVSMSIRDFNQSMQKKESYAYAFAKVLDQHGIKAYSHSRMD